VEPSKVADYHYLNSVKVTTPLVSILTHKSLISVLEAHDSMLAINRDVHHSNRKAVSDKFDDTYKQLTNCLKKCVDIAHEKGASSRLSAFPVHKHGINVDLLMPCLWEAFFSVEHSLSCSFGGFPTIRHNELRNVTADGPFIPSLFKCTY